MKRKGFTLIELLAVIIILAVVALITVPTILDVVDSAKEKSRISSVNSLLDATRLYMSEAMLDDSIDLSGNLLDIINNRVKGTKPDEGEIRIDGNDIGIAVKIDGYCYIKDYSEEEIRKTNDENCIIFKALEASDYVMTALDAVINYEECVANLNSVLETSYTEEELDKICKNELKIDDMLLKEKIMYLYHQGDISAIEEANIAELDYVEEKGYEKCFEYENIVEKEIDDFDINYDVCMESFEDENICNGGKVDFEGTGNLMTLKEYIRYTSSLEDEIFDYLINIGFIENIKYRDIDGIKITNYLCYEGTGILPNETVLPIVTDVVIPTTINGLKVVEIDAVDYEEITKSSFAFRGITSVDFTHARYLEKIGKAAFRQNFWGNTYGIEGEIDLSNLTNLKEIGEAAFALNKISSLKLNDKITYIGYNAFDGNQLPDEQAFIYKRTDLNNDGIAEIDNTVLISYGGANRKDVVFPPSIEEIWAVFDSMDVSTCLYGVLDLSQTKITEIKDRQFTSCGFTSVKLPETLISIGEGAFDRSGVGGELDLSNLTNLTTIESGAFYGCGVKNLKLPSSVTTIGSGAFYNSQISGELDLSNTKLTEINDGAFAGNQITSIKLPSTLTTIGRSAFHVNQISGELDLSNLANLTAIDYQAFSDNQISGELDLSDLINLSTIGEGAFSSNQITSVKLPSSITTIDPAAFHVNQISGELDLSSLTNLTTIGYNAFSDNQITSVKLSNGVTTIGSNAFSYNPNLTLIEIDNIKDAISESPWGASNATITWLKDSE